MINTRQEAENWFLCQISAAGHRSNGPIRSGMYGSAGTYQKTANEEIVLLPMMETKTAVENMESILTSTASTASISVRPTSGFPMAWYQSSTATSRRSEDLREDREGVRQAWPLSWHPLQRRRRRGSGNQHGLQARDPSNESGLMMTYAKMQVAQTRKDSAGKA